MVLETERLILRPFETGDAAEDVYKRQCPLWWHCGRQDEIQALRPGPLSEGRAAGCLRGEMGIRWPHPPDGGARARSGGR